MMLEHIPFRYKTCECDECSRIRETKKAEKQREAYFRHRFGPNYKNVMAGIGDQ